MDKCKQGPGINQKEKSRVGTHFIRSTQIDFRKDEQPGQLRLADAIRTRWNRTGGVCLFPVSDDGVPV